MIPSLASLSASVLSFVFGQFGRMQQLIKSQHLTINVNKPNRDSTIFEFLQVKHEAIPQNKIRWRSAFTGLPIVAMPSDVAVRCELNPAGHDSEIQQNDLLFVPDSNSIYHVF